MHPPDLKDEQSQTTSTLPKLDDDIAQDSTIDQTGLVYSVIRDASYSTNDTTQQPSSHTSQDDGAIIHNSPLQSDSNNIANNNESHDGSIVPPRKRRSGQSSSAYYADHERHNGNDDDITLQYMQVDNNNNTQIVYCDGNQNASTTITQQQQPIQDQSYQQQPHQHQQLQQPQLQQYPSAPHQPVLPPHAIVTRGSTNVSLHRQPPAPPRIPTYQQSAQVAQLQQPRPSQHHHHHASVVSTLTATSPQQQRQTSSLLRPVPGSHIGIDGQEYIIDITGQGFLYDSRIHASFHPHPYLSFPQGPVDEPEAVDSELLLSMIHELRLRERTPLTDVCDTINNGYAKLPMSACDPTKMTHLTDVHHNFLSIIRRAFSAKNGLSFTTLELATNYMHRVLPFLDTQSDRFKEYGHYYPLIFLLLASKFQDRRTEPLKLAQVIHFVNKPIERNLYLVFECDVLHILRWTLASPIPGHFISLLAYCGVVFTDDLVNGQPPTDETVRYMHHFFPFFIYLYVRHIVAFNVLPSMIAACIIAATRHLLRIEPLWNSKLTDTTQYSYEDIQYHYIELVRLFNLHIQSSAAFSHLIDFSPSSVNDYFNFQRQNDASNNTAVVVDTGSGDIQCIGSHQAMMRPPSQHEQQYCTYHENDASSDGDQTNHALATTTAVSAAEQHRDNDDDSASN